MQTRRIGIPIALVAVAGSCIACYTTSDRFIVGTYKAESPCSNITLIVNRDHSFAQRVQTRDGKANSISGVWVVDAKGWITFKPFLDFLNNTQGQQLEAAIFRAELLPKGITLGPFVIKCPDSDHQIDYVK